MAFSSLTFFFSIFLLDMNRLGMHYEMFRAQIAFPRYEHSQSKWHLSVPSREKKRNHKHRVFFKSFNVEIIITNTGIHLTMIHKQKNS